MKALIESTSRFLDRPLGLRPRLLLVAATAMLIPCFLLPLWKLTMYAPQYPDGLRMHIYSWRLDSGNGGLDLREINLLNHYIGMRDLSTAEFTEFRWMPFVVGVLGLLFLRAAVIGKASKLVDMLVLFTYFGAFSLWSFAYKLYRYGHDLAPTAAVKVPPFMPPLFGGKQLANFEVYSYPGLGSYALLLAFLLLVTAAAAQLRDFRAAERSRGSA